MERPPLNTTEYLAAASYPCEELYEAALTDLKRRILEQVVLSIEPFVKALTYCIVILNTVDTLRRVDEFRYTRADAAPKYTLSHFYAPYPDYYVITFSESERVMSIGPTHASIQNLRDEMRCF